jgi:2-C-methyl-D-erythritol 4-phosphate cytidylyltransferase
MGPGFGIIIAAGGSGERFGRAQGKQLARVAGRSVLSWTLQAVDTAGADLIVVVCPATRMQEYESEAVSPARLVTPVAMAPSGDTRQASVASGLNLVPPELGVVAIHDGARPLVAATVFRDAVSLISSSDCDGVVVGHPSYDTLKMVEGARVIETPDRSRFWAAQTPQVFRQTSLRAAHEAAEKDGFVGTDDAAIVERWGGVVLMLEGPRDNIKITTPDDAAFAEAVLARREREGV